MDPGAGRPSRQAPEIKVRDGGPYKVTGPARIIDADGGEHIAVAPGQVVVLCRCGHSASKPFCDSSHKRVGFDAPERAGG